MAQRHTNAARRVHGADPRNRPAAILRQVRVQRAWSLEPEGLVWLGLLATMAAICVLVIIRALGE